MNLRSLMRILVFVLVGSASGASEAKLPPMPQKDLVSISQHIIRGEVLSTSLIKASLARPRWRGSYRSKVRILAVEKGGLKPGQVISIGWGVLRWVGPGRQPPGHWDHPTFPPCQRFRAYLHGGKGGYSVVHYNGKRCMSRCFTGKLPERVGQTTRCLRKKRVR